MKTFLLVRHGESVSNSGKYFTGQLNVDLTETGYKQAQRTAEFIVENFTVDAIYSSDLQRAYHTAEAISRLTGKEIVADKGLREVDGGKFDGVVYNILEKMYPVEYGHWLSDIGTSKCLDGESMRDVQIRGDATIRRIAAEVPDGSTTVITTHAAFLRAMECLWKELPLTEMKNLPWVSNASVTVVEFDDESAKFTIVRRNLYEHLGDLRTELPKNA